MITDLLLGFLLDVLTGALGLMPAYELPESVTEFGDSIGNAVATANGIFPVVTVGICIAVMVGARLFVAAWAGIAWIYNKIPLKFT